MTIYAEPATIGNSTLAASLLALPAGAKVPEHVHATQTELLYVLEGSGTMTIAGTEVAGELDPRPWRSRRIRSTRSTPMTAVRAVSIPARLRVLSKTVWQGKAMTDLAAILAGNVREAARFMRDLDDRQPGALAAPASSCSRIPARPTSSASPAIPAPAKPTAVDGLTSSYRAAGEAGLASCASIRRRRSRGARIPGDRIRMQRHALDEGVFIRSLATRGFLGGLSRSTFDVTHVLDAMGFERILIETVGVGQDEVDVMRAAHTTVVVTVPGLGDDVQAIKSGLLEVADVLVVNKADREGADRTERDLMGMLDLRAGERRDIEIVRTIATRGTASGSGIVELATAVEAHRTRAWTGQGAAARATARASAQIRELIRALLADRAGRAMATRATELADAVVEHRRDPWTIAEELVASL